MFFGAWYLFFIIHTWHRYNQNLDQLIKNKEENGNADHCIALVKQLYKTKKTDCHKLLKLIPSSKTQNLFAMACELIQLNDATKYTPNKSEPIEQKGASNFFMVAQGSCLAGPLDKELETLYGKDATLTTIFNVEQGKKKQADANNDKTITENAVKKYVTGQFFEEKQFQQLCNNKTNGNSKTCELLKLKSTQIRLFFATRTCRDAIRVFEGVNDLETRLESISCLTSTKSKKRALHSCTYETKSSLKTKAKEYGVDIGIHTFLKGEYLIRAGRVASREIDMRTRQCDSFVLKSGQVIITDPADADVFGINQEITKDQDALEMVTAGTNDSYVTAYQEEVYNKDDPRLRCVGKDVRAMEDTVVYIVRLHHDKETLGRRFAALGDVWCCASTDARSGKGTTTNKPMRHSSYGSNNSNESLLSSRESTDSLLNIEVEEASKAVQFRNHVR